MICQIHNGRFFQWFFQIAAWDLFWRMNRRSRTASFVFYGPIAMVWLSRTIWCPIQPVIIATTTGARMELGKRPWRLGKWSGFPKPGWRRWSWQRCGKPDRSTYDVFFGGSMVWFHAGTVCPLKIGRNRAYLTTKDSVSIDGHG